MTSNEAVVAMIDALEAARVPYMLVGAYACNVYGVPRATREVDDARNLIAVHAQTLDWDYIHRWCDQHGTRQLLDQIRRSIPKI